MGEKKRKCENLSPVVVQSAKIVGRKIKELVTAYILPLAILILADFY